MQTNFLALISFAFLVLSCTSNTILKKPEDLIPKDTMTQLLVDMEIAASIGSIRNKDGHNKIDYMPLVYEKYGIDSTRFSHSNSYYMSSINQYKVIFDDVNNRLNFIKDSLLNVRKLNDSIERNRKLTDEELEKQKTLIK